MLKNSVRLSRASARWTSVHSQVAYSSHYAGNNILGIVREQHGMWERRAPLSPNQVQQLLTDVPGSRVLVQPCTRRIYSNDEYRSAGAEIVEDVSSANLLIGVKQVKKEQLIPNKSYIFFSHTIKAQPYSMPLLDSILEKNVRLYDYECITKDGRDDTPRLVAFGSYAGRAGMIDGLQGLGIRLLAEGYSTPFLHIPNTYMHDSLQHAHDAVRAVGKTIHDKGLPASLAPLVFAFTGTGNVAKGAKEIFELLPHEYVTAEELPQLHLDIKSGKRSNNKLYGIVVTAKEMVRHKNAKVAFDKQDYYRHPHEYVPTFHDEILPYTTMLVNGMYWDARFPRLITKDQLKSLRAKGNKTLKVVADISCDIDGGVEFLSKPTTIEQPFFTYVPEKDTEVENVSNAGVLMLGVDNLPTELPADASRHFGQRLLPLLPPLLKSKGSADMEDIPAEMRRACLTSAGQLMPKWQYISRLREQAAVLTTTTSNDNVPSASIRMEITGHLFDTGLINQVLDTLEVDHDVNFSIVNCEVRPNSTTGAQHSRILLQITGSDASKIRETGEAIRKMVKKHPRAEGDVNVVEDEKQIKVTQQKRVLLFGAGRVALPIAKLFNEKENVHLMVATEDAAQAQVLLDCMPGEGRASFAPFKFPQDNHKLPALIKQADVVVSLLPATMHFPIAQEAVEQRRHMVTASYVSPEMQALHEKAKKEGVILLNEVGLDPGIDHMLIMKAVDSIHSRGGEVKELVSLCGGLPDPVAADNPLRYKFSWSPRGVLNASGNAAQYLNDGKVVKVEGKDLLLAGTPSSRFPTLRLEVLPNRNSLMYSDLYNIQKVDSICRGTLRYEGWSNAMYALRSLDLFVNEPITSINNGSVRDYLKTLFPQGLSSQHIAKYFAGRGVKDVKAAMEAMQWLGLTDDAEEQDIAAAESCHGNTPIDALCKLLETRLKFEANEKDMVAMFHSIEGEFPDKSRETHTSRLLAFGVPGGDSAMSATVGYTTAAAVELIVDNKLANTDLHGVLIPTDPRIYNPILDRLETLGITWTESVRHSKPKN